ncbi:MAG TPA: NADH-quinone oxidoreductase subunit C [Actinomycetota bacterium]|nr:NADH-quinone oxidoreductase subunit C [Actinomycetota bacterium]
MTQDGAATGGRDPARADDPRAVRAGGGTTVVDRLEFVEWLRADEWDARARALAAEGWWLADLAGVDRLGIEGRHGYHRGVHGGPRAGERDDAGAGTGNAAHALEGDGVRFEIVVQLLHHERRQRATVHVEAPGEPPTVPSVLDVWPTVAFMEREAYDLLGIRFEGHPDLRRILMPDEWEGHPLRKDYGVGKITIQFAPQPFLQIDAPGQSPNPVEAGHEVDELGQPARASERYGGAGRGPEEATGRR